ncbi:MAG: acyl-CoA dehydrogenase family protein [Bacteroidales bacterium]|nr:acyl-CoA dehydrogenase family protein [Bacteroidales bacterium]
MNLNLNDFPYLNETHKMIRESVRDFAEREIAPVAQELDEKAEFSYDLTKKLGEMGLMGIVVPEEFGGQGLDYLAYVIAVEELARVDSSQAATVAAHNSLGIGPILNYGTEEQKKIYLPKLVTGEALWAFGLTEPAAGSDSRGTKTNATLKDGQWTINGSKTFITNGASKINIGATVQTVTNTDEFGKKEFTTILVDSIVEGFVRRKMENKMMWRASDTAELFFTDVKVPEENILGHRGEGSHIMLATLDSGRLAIGAMGLGLAQGALELSIKYAKERKQFGRPIAQFEAIAFYIAEMATKIEAARNLLYRATYLKTKGKQFSLEAAMAKYYCSEVAKEVADLGVQIHGGYGLMKDYAIERFYRDQRLLQIGEGTTEIQKLVISRYLTRD